jgi:glycosyltransferase involved in cell wall biosynthesis
MIPLPRVLQISTADVLGGAERIARNLHREYARRGLSAAMAVGRRATEDLSVFVIPNQHAGGVWRRFWWRCHQRWQPNYGRRRSARLAVRLAHNLAEPMRLLDQWRGREDYRYPGTSGVISAGPFEPEVIHCHNLHGKYFDLRALPELSHTRPVFATLHDAWLLAGHCAHSFTCERWRTGCGHCPDLSIYPAIRRDATAHNWRVKQRIFSACRLYVAAPSRWLTEKVTQSVLAPACAELRVIPNGVDTTVYLPGDRKEARRRLGLPQDACILLFTGYRPAANPWKDFKSLSAAVDQLASDIVDRPILFVSVGGSKTDSPATGRCVRHVPFVADERLMADYYRSADVYVHAAKVDTFPNSVLEALACGTPVVATAVGGIPEQVVHATEPMGTAISGHEVGGSPDSPTGILVPPSDAAGLAYAMGWLLKHDDARAAFSRNAVADVGRRFTLQLQADAYVEWYERVLDECRARLPASSTHRL